MNKIFQIIIALFLVTSISSCLKEQFDTPPTGGKDPNINVNFHIDSLKARYSGVNYSITEDLVISAIVTADDKSGNFYKQIIIQDSTGGITLLLAGSNIFNDYPIGRRIFIKLKGLYVVNYKGVFQIAGSIADDGSFNGIPFSLYDRYILKGSYYHEVLPKVVTISQLNASNIDELIEIDNAEFQLSDVNKTFADAYNKVSQSRTIKDCHGGSMVTYNSGYATFANERTPSGNGKFIAIYSVYNATGQLIIRDPSDLPLNDTRCGGGIPAGPGISALRTLFSGGTTIIPANTFLTGIVISDLSGANISAKSIIFQDTLSGANIYFPAGHSYPLNEKLRIDVSGLTMQLYPPATGSFEISGANTANVQDLGLGTITPRGVTAAQLSANSNAWEYTLIKVTGATISGGTGGTYSGSTNLTDATGSVPIYTKATASFAGTTYPTTTVSVTAIVNTHSSAVELDMRNAADVQ